MHDGSLLTLKLPMVVAELRVLRETEPSGKSLDE